MVVDGRYQFERLKRTYSSRLGAERKADCLNMGKDKVNGNNIKIK